MSVAFVGIGSNLEDPARQVKQACVELDSLAATRLVRASSLYRTAPMGYGAQPDFVNAVAQLETALLPEELLAELLAIEARHGRRRSFANAPRTLDLDLLLYGEVQLRTAKLELPHPRMHERAFVLVPLVEIAPETVIPGLGSARARLERLGDQAVERMREGG